MIAAALILALVAVLAWTLHAIAADRGTYPHPPPPPLEEDPPTLIQAWPVHGFPRDEPDRVRPYVPAARQPSAAEQTRDHWAGLAWDTVNGERWPHLTRQWQDDTGSFAAIREAA